MKQIDWFERRFNFSSHEIIFPALLERLMSTPIRIEEKLKEINTQFYSIKISNKWAILEHVGHLADLEPLWQGRLEDILQQKAELRSTDITNAKTDLANHTLRHPDELVYQFKELRKTTVERLMELTEQQLFQSARHPRLKIPMRTLDLFFFVAEHDDHHLSKISEINRVLSTSKNK